MKIENLFGDRNQRAVKNLLAIVMMLLGAAFTIILWHTGILIYIIPAVILEFTGWVIFIHHDKY